MFQTALRMMLAASLCLGTVACKKKAKPALKPGELTEVQKADLKKKALENYKKLVEKYPDSPHASAAQERVRALSAPPKK